MRWTRRPVRVACTAAVLVLAGLAAACTPPPDPPPAVSTVDQQVAPPSGLGNTSSFAARCAPANVPYEYQTAQTFTAGRTGTLDRVGTNMIRVSGPTPAPLAVSIQTVAADGTPSGVEIGSGTYDGPSNVVGILWNMPLSTPAAVTAGTRYAIVISESTCTDPPSNGWNFEGESSTTTDPYPGGQAFLRAVGAPGGWYAGVPVGTNFDLYFDTWVR